MRPDRRSSNRRRAIACRLLPSPTALTAIILRHERGRWRKPAVSCSANTRQDNDSTYQAATGPRRRLATSFPATSPPPKRSPTSLRHRGSVWLGEWHTHATGPAPSGQDLVSYDLLLADRELHFHLLLAVIALPDPDHGWDRPRLSGWLVTPGQARQVPLLRRTFEEIPAT